MSKCVVDPDVSIAKCWAVCLDTETSRCEVSLWLVFGPEAEGVGDAIARECSDGMEPAALLACASAQLPALGLPEAVFGELAAAFKAPEG